MLDFEALTDAIGRQTVLCGGDLMLDEFAARGACDRLIVGLNSDASVKRLKGEGRPVQDERARAEVLLLDVLPGFSTTSPVDRARAGKA
jgi:hypothetical protein